MSLNLITNRSHCSVDKLRLTDASTFFQNRNLDWFSERWRRAARWKSEISPFDSFHYQQWVLREVQLLWHEEWVSLKRIISKLNKHFLAILVLYLTRKLLFDDDTATILYHGFTTCVYFCCIIGAIVADSWWGKFHTILWLSIVYVCGSSVIALGAVEPWNMPATWDKTEIPTAYSWD